MGYGVSATGYWKLEKELLNAQQQLENEGIKDNACL